MDGEDRHSEQQPRAERVEERFRFDGHEGDAIRSRWGIRTTFGDERAIPRGLPVRRSR
jgi:hypothetical protein